MTTKKTLRLIKKLGDSIEQMKNIQNALNESYFFEELMSWDVIGIYYNCKIVDGWLYSENGETLSNDGTCMDEEIPYFVNQHTGYCGDDYYGTLFVKVADPNTFVAINYEC